MKKLLLIFISTLCVLGLTACSPTGDTEHAAITLSTSSGTVYSAETYTKHTDLIFRTTESGEAIAARKPFVVSIKPDETVDVCLYCSACGYKEHFKFDSYGSEVIYCDCPEDGDENGNTKEYACILVKSAESAD